MTDQSERQLKVFQDDGQTDWVVAYDAEDAQLVWALHNGYDSVGAYRDDWDGEVPEFTEYTKPLAIICNAAGEIDDTGKAVTRAPAEWAEREGRGFLCSTEY